MQRIKWLLSLLVFFVCPVFAVTPSDSNAPLPSKTSLPYKRYYEYMTFGQAWPIGSKDYDRGALPGTPFDNDFDWGGFGASLGIGKMWSPVWGSEIGYSFFNGANFNYFRPSDNMDINITQMNNVIDLAAKGIWHLGWGRLNLFGKLGPALVVSSAIETDNQYIYKRTKVAPALYGAAGIQYSFDGGRWNVLEQVSAISNSASPAIAPGLKNNAGLWMISFGVEYAFTPL